MTTRKPAAGASGGASLRLARPIKWPEFLYFYKFELVSLASLQDSLPMSVYMILLIQMSWKEGHFLGGYQQLMAALTPPRPQQGNRRRLGPTMWEIRSAVQALIDVELITRGVGNEPQGQLRLWLHPRVQKIRKIEKRFGTFKN